MRDSNRYRRWLTLWEALWTLVIRLGLLVLVMGIRQGSIQFARFDLRRTAIFLLCTATLSLGVGLLYALGYQSDRAYTPTKGSKDKAPSLKDLRRFWQPWIRLRVVETLILLLGSIDAYYLARRFQGWSTQVPTTCSDPVFESLGWSAVPCYFSIVGDFYSRLSAWLWMWLVLTLLAAWQGIQGERQGQGQGQGAAPL
jgi:hypothetical protein